MALETRLFEEIRGRLSGKPVKAASQTEDEIEVEDYSRPDSVRILGFGNFDSSITTGLLIPNYDRIAEIVVGRPKRRYLGGMITKDGKRDDFNLIYEIEEILGSSPVGAPKTRIIDEENDIYVLKYEREVPDKFHYPALESGKVEKKSVSDIVYIRPEPHLLTQQHGISNMVESATHDFFLAKGFGRIFRK